ncbi:MAG: YkgJ family cysteine cluster protein [Lachnospiraceae bacterium]|nr:YkgJ family cysteine cluster protein [Lachnospiraceae bacterium]
MRRNVSLAEISDGKLYSEHDMVKADCRGCEGCSDCCRGMGESIILDPYDAFRLSVGLGRPFADFLEKEVELHVVDGVILPNLRMCGPDEACAFLNAQGRCSVHPCRPGICRIFPLGRYYEGDGYRYFLQTGECRAVRSKVKVSKWIDTPNGQKMRAFVIRWHNLLRDTEAELARCGDDRQREINLVLLRCFYLTPYDETVDFCVQYDEREAQYKNYLLQK